jgi:hypothetical protein
MREVVCRYIRQAVFGGHARYSSQSLASDVIAIGQSPLGHDPERGLQNNVCRVSPFPFSQLGLQSSYIGGVLQRVRSSRGRPLLSRYDDSDARSHS